MKRKWTFKEYYLLFLAVTLLIYGAYSMISSKKTEDYSEFIYQSELSIDQVEKVNNSQFTTAIGLAYWGAEAVGTKARGLFNFNLSKFKQVGDVVIKAKKWVKSLVP